jgi:hypothetical protein
LGAQVPPVNLRQFQTSQTSKPEIKQQLGVSDVFHQAPGDVRPKLMILALILFG